MPRCLWGMKNRPINTDDPGLQKTVTVIIRETDHNGRLEERCACGHRSDYAPPARRGSLAGAASCLLCGTKQPGIADTVGTRQGHDRCKMAYDKELLEIPGCCPWEKPTSFLVKDAAAPNGWRADTSGRRPSRLSKPAGALGGHGS
jgi:hypothetical protein